MAKTININIPRGFDDKSNSSTVIIDATNSFDPEGDSIRYLWKSEDIRIKDSNKPEIEIEVKSIEDEINSYKLYLVLTDGHKGKSIDSVFVNVYGEKNKDPKSIIYKMEGSLPQ